MANTARGPVRAKLERRAERLGVAQRLHFLGHVAERSILARVFATADCFVHPNPGEPYGLTPLEALAAGCRVVAPWTGGTGETLTREWRLYHELRRGAFPEPARPAGG